MVSVLVLAMPVAAAADSAAIAESPAESVGLPSLRVVESAVATLAALGSAEPGY